MKDINRGVNGRNEVFEWVQVSLTKQQTLLTLYSKVETNKSVELA